MSLVVLVVGVRMPAAAQTLAITGIRGDLRFGTSYENDDISETPTHQNLERLYFEERLGLRTDGFAYDPGLARFSLGFELGLFQDKVNNTVNGAKTSQSGDGVLTGYDLRTSLLNQTSYAFDLYGRRSENNTRRDFAGNVKTEVNDFGGLWRLRDLPLPSVVSFQEVETKQHFTLLPTGVQQDETRRIVTYNGERRWDTNTFTADYRFDDVDDRARPNGNYQIHNAGGYDMWRFGAPDDYLSSTLRALIREGNFNGTTLLEHEGLHLRHSSSLTSDYAYNFAYLDQSGAGSQTSQNGFASLQYQLYQSLTSALTGNVGYAELSPGHDVSYGTAGTVGYHKEIPWGGVLLGGGGVGYQIDDRSVPGGIINVVDEAHTFNAVDQVTLNNPDVEVSTIVVTDQAHDVFAVGIDYTVESLGRRTVLNRVVFGGIAPGETVLVSYTSVAAPELKTASYPINFNGGLDYTWVYLFYDGYRFRQSVLTGNPAQTLGPIDSDTAGVQFRYTYPLGEFVLRNDYTTYDSDDVRYNVFNFSQSGSARAREDLTLTLNALQSFYDFSLPSENRTFLSERASTTWRPILNVLVDGYVGFRYQRETATPRNQLVEFGSRGRYTIGAFTLTLAYDHAIQDVGTSGRIGDLVRLDVIRNF